MWPGPLTRSRLLIARLSNFLAARPMARGQSHDAHALDRAHSSRKEKRVPAGSWLGRRAVVGAHGPLPKKMRRINPVGSVAVAAGPDQDKAVVALAFTIEADRCPRFRPPPTSRLRIGLRGSSAECAPTGAPRCEFMRRRSLGRGLASVDTRTHVFLRSARPYPCAAMMLAAMVVSISLFDGRAPHATSNGRIRPEGRLRLNRLPATAKPAFFHASHLSIIDQGNYNSSQIFYLKFLLTINHPPVNDVKPNPRRARGELDLSIATSKLSLEGRVRRLHHSLLA
jgi:hypothetical protein